MEKVKLDLVHKDKAMTEVQEGLVRKIGLDHPHLSFLEAKEEYFNNQAEYDSTLIKNEGGWLPGRRACLLKDSKLGATVVFSKELCYQLGFKPDDKIKDIGHKLRNFVIDPKNYPLH